MGVRYNSDTSQRRSRSIYIEAEAMDVWYESKPIVVEAKVGIARLRKSPLYFVIVIDIKY